MKSNLTLLTLLVLFCSSKSFAFVVYEDTRIWDQDEITFYFIDGTIKQQNEVKQFAKLWQRYTGIKFKYTRKKPSFFRFSKYYTITFKGSGNEATTGAINGTINFGNLSDNIIIRKTTILHEFGHMLGLGHEHQRKDRPPFLSDKKLVNACIKTQNQTNKWCNENLLNKEKDKVFIQSEYDATSIMHYKLESIVGNDYKNFNDLNTSDEINSLSYTDKYFIAMLYNQNLSDNTLGKMHKQDLWQQTKFEKLAKQETKNAIMQLKTSSCKALEYPNKTKDGKYCNIGFMIIGNDDFSFPDVEFNTCYTSFADINKKMLSHDYCKLSYNQLSQKRLTWSKQFAQLGNCKILKTNVKNNQEFYCNDGYSFVTNSNDLIGDKTICYGNEESAYLAMQENSICNLSSNEFITYEAKKKDLLNQQMQTKYCKVVKKKYSGINCPSDYDYTVINLDNSNQPINNKCFASKYQAINAMNQITFCKI